MKGYNEKQTRKEISTSDILASDIGICQTSSTRKTNENIK